MRAVSVTERTPKKSNQPRARSTQKPTRIQREKTEAILEAALEEAAAPIPKAPPDLAILPVLYAPEE